MMDYTKFLEDSGIKELPPENYHFFAFRNAASIERFEGDVVLHEQGGFLWIACPIETAVIYQLKYDNELLAAFNWDRFNYVLHVLFNHAAENELHMDVSTPYRRIGGGMVRKTK